jgi:dihydrofolate reductase
MRDDMRKVILYIAQTLDGYIAEEDGGVRFLDDYMDHHLANEHIQNFLSTVDTDIMGRKTYDWMIEHVPNIELERETYVVSKTLKSNDSIHVVSSDLVSLIHELKQKKGKNIWLVGGGELICSFIEHDLIDEYQIAIIPKLLGTGRKLFLSHHMKQMLKLTKIDHLDDIVILTYLRV